MPASHLRCSQCGTERPLEGVSACDRCFAPLEPVYDLEIVRRDLTRESIAAGPPSLWRYAPLLPVAPPEPALLAPGFTPLVAAPRLAAEVGVGELHLKLDTANPTHSFKDRVVAVASAKAQELGLEALACASTGNLAHAVAARAAVEGLPAAIFCPADVEREKLLASAAHGATIYAVRGNYDACSRLTIELSFELPWAFVNVTLRAYYAEGSKTLAYEVAEQLGWELTDVVAVPVASGSLLTRTERGFGDFLELGLVDGPAPRLIGSQPQGCSPVADAFAEGRLVSPLRPDTVARSLAIGNPADGDAAIEAVRRSGGAIHAVPEEEIGENMLLLASTAGVFGETAAGVTLGALRAAVAAGDVGPRDRVVLFVTGDGLKTLAPVGYALQPVEIDADADGVLDALRVAA
jgi:threonine synthase